MRIHLVDGTYELFRAYFGAPKATGTAGSEVGATRGILWSLVSLLRDDRVTHVACAFDHVIESFRNDLFPGYKTSEGVPDDLLAQFPLAERATHALGLVTWPMVEFEADDALATAAARWGDAPDVEQVLICTPDKDMTQCVRDGRIVCFDRMRRKMIDEAAVVEKFGVPPASIAGLARARRRQRRRISRRAALGRQVGRGGAGALRTPRSHSGQRTAVERERARRGCSRAPACANIETQPISIVVSRRCAPMRRSRKRSTTFDGRGRACGSSRISVASLAMTTSSGAYRSGATIAVGQNRSKAQPWAPLFETRVKYGSPPFYVF